jgi:hypothetical protein
VGVLASTPFSRIAVLCLCLGPCLGTRGQILISEFQAANNSTLRDEDGAFEDWIELANVSGSPVNLAGWYLTDDPARLDKWELPSTNLNAGQTLLVFASNKDRRDPGGPLHTNFRLSADGEFLALVRPDGAGIASQFAPPYPLHVDDVSYGHPAVAQSRVLVAPGVSGRLLVPTANDAGLDTHWTEPGFDDAGWPSVQTGVGFDREATPLHELVGTDIADRMWAVNASTYLRLPFTVNELSAAQEFKLRIRYDDGFIAYLNGAAVAARNAPVFAAGGLRPTAAWIGLATSKAPTTGRMGSTTTARTRTAFTIH